MLSGAVAFVLAACSSGATTSTSTTPAATAAPTAAPTSTGAAETGPETAPGTAPDTTADSSATAPPVAVTSTTVTATAPALPVTAPSGTLSQVKPGFLLAADRCAANKAAGKITYLSSFDFSAAAGIIDVIIAKQSRYFELMCLDVDIKSSTSTANYPLIGQNQAQFAAADSIGELLTAGASASSDFVVLCEEGKATLDTLIVKDGLIPAIADLRTQTIGTKGDALPPSIQAMLAASALVAGTDYQTADIQAQYGLDPAVDLTIPTIVAFPASKASEPGALNRATIRYHTFDPTDAGIPGSFGLLYTNRAFASAHPSAVQDFVRATMKGLQDAIAEPADASRAAFDLITAQGNPNALTSDGENFRWKTQAGLIKKSTPEGQPLGIPDLAGLQAEVDAYGALGAYGAAKPILDGHIDPAIVAGVYDTSGTIIWP